MNAPRPEVKTLEKAEFWIGVLHQRSVDDCEEMNELRDRIAKLERRGWWRRLR